MEAVIEARRADEAECTECGRRWSGKAECHCRLCHRHFTSSDPFDNHRPSYEGCLDPATVRTRDGKAWFRLQETKNRGPIWARDREYTGPGSELASEEAA